ncbi:hypothetical protein BE21_28320 [Sorangium cellulosum]|uniref:Secreted protein n=1 Tax=Sorangium cellulosum TaxID=56 RepID=A0A150TSF5_SORCE|nr:hypothetical protein BE21_28320 [Sorangium cellulosum]
MGRATGRAGARAISMAAALLSLGAGAALVGSSCTGLPCGDGDCMDPLGHTCPWECLGLLSPQYDYFTEHFNPRDSLMVWIGDPRDAPDCTSSNAYHVRDFYQNPKSLDRCPRCVAEPLRESSYFKVELRKGAQCVHGGRIGGTTIRAFMIPVAWDGSCISEVVALDPAVQDADVGVGASDGDAPACAVSLSSTDVAATWGSLVRVCERSWEYDEICWRLSSTCAPEPGPGFRECLQYHGDEELPVCPNSHPELVQAYTGVKGCSRCGAEDPIDDENWRETTSTLTFYADEQCTQPLPTTNIIDQCFNLPSGALPRGVTATLTVERIAACEAVGGEQEGELAPGNVASFCCRPPA